MSVDGVTQAHRGPDQDREDGFEHGGWAGAVEYASFALEDE